MFKYSKLSEFPQQTPGAYLGSWQRCMMELYDRWLTSTKYTFGFTMESDSVANSWITKLNLNSIRPIHKLIVVVFWKYLFLARENGKKSESSYPFFNIYTNSVDWIVIRLIKNYSSITYKLICFLDCKRLSQLTKWNRANVSLRFCVKICSMPSSPKVVSGSY